MNLDLGHARTLHRLLKGLLASSAVAVAGLSALGACAGGPDDADPTGPCRVAPRDAPPSRDCVPFELTIIGSTASCAADTSVDTCQALCGVGNCTVDTARSVVVCYGPCAVDGRRPPGLRPRDLKEASTLGEHVANMAHHEAAAVDAFMQLAREMRAHDAPPSLVRALERAARDERRHAALCEAFAAAEGAEVELPDVAPTEVRSLLAIAEDNAREGCGRELLGAAVGLHVSEHARSADARELFTSITRDELRHAAVSLRMQHWIRTRLTREERASVDALMCAALAAGTASTMPAELAPPTDTMLASVGTRIAQTVMVWLARQDRLRGDPGDIGDGSV